MFGRIHLSDEITQVVFSHGGTSGRRHSAIASPDVEKDRTTCSFNDVWWGIMGDEKFESVSRVVLFHLLSFFPWCKRIVGEDDVAIVGGREDILDPEVARRDASISELRVLADGGIIAPSAADAENACGGATVAFFFDCGSSGIGVQSETPDQPVFAEASLP